jgi:DNA-binding NtrC family response regulator
LFCDEHLSEGCFSDLISPDIPDRKVPRVVVTIRTGEWDKYLQMMRLGAYDVLRCPFCPTDVEFVVLRAREEQRRIGRWIEKTGAGRTEWLPRVAKPSS